MNDENRIAVITGGSRGIGLATAKVFLREGYKVYLVSQSLTSLEKGKLSLDQKYQDKVVVYAMDVSDPIQCKQFSDELMTCEDHVDALVNCAGINIRKNVQDLDVTEYKKIVATDLDGTFYMCKYILPLLQKSVRGKVVNVSSLMAVVTRPNVAPYAAAKAGVSQLTKALAVEWSKFNINVNSVIPGFTLTEMAHDLLEDKAFNQYVLDRTPLKRWVKPEEVGEAIYFLSSNKADFITGVNLPVDGGIAASLGWRKVE